jgi:REP element-mobilizing transposase RayT
MPPDIGRKSLIHLAPIEQHNTPVIIFLTVCTEHRRRVLDSPEAHALLTGIWSEANLWLVGRYVLMPDHIHLFCAPGGHLDAIPGVMQWVKYWKRLASQRWPDQAQTPVFQRDGFDRQLRSGESYSEKWEYVRANPVRAGLVKTADEWPYQGELSFLPW